MDLRDLIEREIDHYLEWPTADKSHVTTVSAKLFAEHVARLYADHIPDAGKMVAPDVQGEPVAYVVFASNGNIRIWCADPVQVETLRQQYGEALQPLYAAPQPVEQQAEQDSEQDVAMLLGLLDDCLKSMRDAYPDYDHYESSAYISAMAVFENRTIGKYRPPQAEQQPAPDVSALVEALQAENERLRRDAERYRWLRNRASTEGICVVHIDYWSEEYRGQAHCEVYDGEFLDAAIDHARRIEENGND